MGNQGVSSIGHVTKPLCIWTLVHHETEVFIPEFALLRCGRNTEKPTCGASLRCLGFVSVRCSQPTMAPPLQAWHPVPCTKRVVSYFVIPNLSLVNLINVMLAGGDASRASPSLTLWELFTNFLVTSGASSQV